MTRGIDGVLDRLEERFGFDRAGLERRGAVDVIHRRIAESGLYPESWIAATLGSPRQLRALITELVVPETYFYRGRTTLETIQNEVLPDLLRRTTDRRVVVWSAGCSTGEEAWTIAAIADDLGALDRVEVIGTDLSAEHVRIAREGAYRPWSLRNGADARLGQRIRQKGDRWHIADRLRPAVRFFTSNLIEPGPIHVRADLIICRNVLVYFTPRAQRIATERMAHALMPEGRIVTAPTDPMLEGDMLERERCASGIWYRHPSSARDTPPSAHASVAPVADRRERRRAARPIRVPGYTLPPEPDTVELRALSGRAPEHALAHIDDALVHRPLTAQLHELRGEVLLSLGDARAARAALARATFLDDTRPLAWWALGLAEAAVGRAVPARVAFGHAWTLAAGQPADEPVPDSDGATWAELRAAIRARLRPTEDDAT